MADGLREKLIAIQKDNGWVDREMAERLGITRARWQQIRSGIYPEISAPLLRSIARAFPDLWPDLMHEIKHGN